MSIIPIPTAARCFDLLALYLVLPDGLYEIFISSPEGADHKIRLSKLSSTIHTGFPNSPFKCLTLTINFIKNNNNNNYSFFKYTDMGINSSHFSSYFTDLFVCLAI